MGLTGTAVSRPSWTRWTRAPSRRSSRTWPSRWRRSWRGCRWPRWRHPGKVDECIQWRRLEWQRLLWQSATVTVLAIPDSFSITRVTLLEWQSVKVTLIPISNGVTVTVDHCTELLLKVQQHKGRDSALCRLLSAAFPGNTFSGNPVQALNSIIHVENRISNTCRSGPPC